MALLLAVVGSTKAQDGVATQPVDPLAPALLGQLPTDTATLSARLQAVDERLKALRATTQTADPNAPGAELPLLDAWTEYRGALTQAVDWRKRIAELTAESQIKQAADEITALKERTRTLRGTSIEPPVSEEQVRTAQAAADATAAEVAALSDALAQRSVLLDSGLAERRAALEADRTALQRQMTTQTSPDQVDPNVAPPVERRVLELRLATTELRIQSLGLQRQLTELLVQRDQVRLDALTKLLEVQRQRASTLATQRSAARVAELESEKADPNSPLQAALVELKLFHTQVMQAYFGNEELLGGLEVGVSASDLTQLQDQLAASLNYWQRVRDTLVHRSGQELTALHRQLEQELNTNRQRMQARDTVTAELLSTLRRLRTVREKTERRYAVLADAVQSQMQRAEPARRAAVQAELATLRASLYEAIQSSLQRIERAADHARQMAAARSTHLTALRGIERDVYWRRVTTPEAEWGGGEWTNAGRDLRSIWRAAWGRPPVADEIDGADAALFGEQRSTYVRVSELRDVVRALPNEPDRVVWWWTLGLAIFGGALGVLILKVARQRSVPLARDIETRYAHAQIEEDDDQEIVEADRSGVSDRINLMILNCIGDLAIPVLLAAALIWGTINSVENVLLRTLIVDALLVVVGTVAAVRLIHHLFEPASAPHRPVPCADPVAGHYRWWLVAAAVYSALVLAVPMLAGLVGTAVSLSDALVQIYKAGLLLMVLLFLVRRPRVLGLLEAHRDHWLYFLIALAHPAMVLLTLALLVLQVIGYALLVTHVGSGAAITLAVILAGVVVSEYLVDFLRRLQPAPPREDKHDSDAVPAGASYGFYLIDLLAAMVRLGVVVGCAIALIVAWRIPVRDEWLSWQSYAMGAAVVMIGLVADRVAHAMFMLLVQRGRLPAGTVKFILRYLRVGIVVVVGLWLASIAQWQMESLWTFLTTLLAMVAIGFVAVWSILSNILATLVILIWRPFHVGEEVELQPEGIKGEVIDINFIYTLLRQEDGRRIAVPNNLFAQKYIVRKPSFRGPQRSLAEQLERETPIDE